MVLHFAIAKVITNFMQLNTSFECSFWFLTSVELFW